jgi:hypothetical protein
MAISEDGSVLYVGLRGARAVRRVDLSSRTPGLQFTLTNQSNDQLVALDLAVQPGNPNTVGVTTGSVASSGTYGPAVYDNGVRRPKMLSIYQGTDLVWTSPNRIVAYNGSHTGSELIETSVDASGVTFVREVREGLSAFSTDLVQVGDRLYGSDGSIVDAASLARIGSFALRTGGSTGNFYGPAVNISPGLAYFLEIGNDGASIHAFSTDTFVKVASRRVTGVSSSTHPANFGDAYLVRWGARGLAFRTTEAVYLIDDAPGL